MSEWLAVWGRLVNCSYWDTHWLYLLARTAKDDWRGVLDWTPHVPELFTRVLAAFQVPVGTATAGCPNAVGAPHRATQLFGNRLDQVDEAPKSAAKLVVHLLKQQQQQNEQQDKQQQQQLPLQSVPSLGLGTPSSGGGVAVQGVLRSQPGPQGLLLLPSSSKCGDHHHATGGAAAAAGEGVPLAPSVAAVADALDTLVGVLEQYAHPSNSGPWSGSIAMFLRHGVHYFMKVGLFVCTMS